MEKREQELFTEKIFTDEEWVTMAAEVNEIEGNKQRDEYLKTSYDVSYKTLSRRLKAKGYKIIDHKWIKGTEADTVKAPVNIPDENSADMENKTIETLEKTEPHLVIIEDVEQEKPVTDTVKKKIGRPAMYARDEKGKNLDKKKLTLEIAPEVHKALKRYQVEEEFKINNYIEQLLRENIPEEYFK